MRASRFSIHQAVLLSKVCNESTPGRRRLESAFGWVVLFCRALHKGKALPSELKPRRITRRRRSLALPRRKWWTAATSEGRVLPMGDCLNSLPKNGFMPGEVDCWGIASAGRLASAAYVPRHFKFALEGSPVLLGCVREILINRTHQPCCSDAYPHCASARMRETAHAEARPEQVLLTGKVPVRTN
jgi:hypothetical protein